MFVRRLHLDVKEFPRDNANSVTEADAWDMLALTPARSTPSVWGRALILDLGISETAARLGVDVAVVRKWANQTVANVVG